MEKYKFSYFKEAALIIEGVVVSIECRHSSEPSPLRKSCEQRDFSLSDVKDLWIGWSRAAADTALESMDSRML
jgi:hypothetical protein